MTPVTLAIKKGTIIPPDMTGWEAHTWYLVDVAYYANNPIHRSLFYTGFLNGKNESPGGYNQLVSLSTPSCEEDTEITDVYYLKSLKKLFSSKELETYAP